MSEITFACPHCGLQLSATDEMFGQVTACPGCNQAFQIPVPQQQGPGPTAGGGPRAPRPAPGRPTPGAPGPARGPQQPAAGPRQPQGQPGGRGPAQQPVSGPVGYGPPPPGYGQPPPGPSGYGQAVQPYGAPPPGGGFPGPFPDRRYRVMKVTDWLVVILLVGIPGVNLIMLLIWAFGGGNFNRQNFARAQLLYLAIAFGLVAVVILAIGGLGAAMSRVKSKLPDAPPPATAPADPASPK